MPNRAVRKNRWKVAALIVIVALCCDYFLYPRFETRAPKIHSRRNALWLHFSWASGKQRESISHLAARMRRDDFQDAYFHVRYIGQSGGLRFRDETAARRLNVQVKAAAPGIRRLAWLYIGNERGITGVDISKVEIRQKITRETQFLTRDCGFDGVQIDYEICSDGDLDFLQLLREIRAATPGKVLAVATPMWLPPPLGAYGWSEKYFGEVAKNCDQIAVMAYDSALYFPRHYVWLIKEQMFRVPRAAKNANPRCEVLLGVPSYEDGGASHWSSAENLQMALRGAREGISQTLSQSTKNEGVASATIDGIALFADYSTDSREWALWRRSFSQKSPSKS
ncbi:Glycosyl hydrolases family 18 [Abditibacterium utsteinense]|uniref:Glycosyl hydrolases family 18 n=1 Tax=Abditibacterium utsteinense TaxID=1960156 RepID=A0A2S8SXB4_9BACT|nr:glycosyl hydrolase family 18 protein [Abditibacterium utsteinense]PQV65443.1 Glycosyl hydrolases family 18 [Abditibacterium utsteinense]